MGDEYLDAVYQGRNEWWRYVVGVVIILFFAFILGAIPLLLAALVLQADGNPATGINLSSGMLEGVGVIVTFPILMSSFIFFFLGIFVAVRWVHFRPLRSLVTPSRSINWERALKGAAAWFVLAGLMVLVEAMLFPGRYEWTFNLARWLPFTVLAVLLVPIQTSAEELFFRGYVLQGAGLLVRNPLVLSVISGVLFALPHLPNPEVSVNPTAVMLFYFLFGAAMAFITLRDNGLELVLGVHAANNLFTVLIANYADSALSSPSAFVANTLDPWYGLISSIIALAVFYALFFFRRPGPAPVKAEPEQG